ncbi:AAA-like domain-containing protein [Lyngbya sp. CCY1209]|uniref:AAA-like domain-containing protein n=1 Tax=Lyngbya sp. CCY1209 TaxID=2886103 RepID=UPI002D20A115|nr:AAA-like domain-containing protein [Lyngbya sp. CCY1209]MEB3885709.1 AAA-like domain-containing protein [Lyngbya sp. CCY1209]
MTNREKLLQFAEALVLSRRGNPLSYIEKVVLDESLQNLKKTYDEIATENGYSPRYLKNGVAPRLWQMLSDILGEKVSKTNCRSLLENQLSGYGNFGGESVRADPMSKPGPLSGDGGIGIESPEGQVPLASQLYIERPPIESICYQEILQPRVLLRIKAPRQMGKTSLMARVLAHGEGQGLTPVRLSFNQVESELFASTDRFLRWLCANVAQQMGLPSLLDEFWDEDMGALVSCSLYFQEYLLEKIDSPLLLALDEVNQLFEHPSLARDVLTLLRSWHEETRDIGIWRKLRLLIVHSTDVYIPLNTNQSPFNVGHSLELPPFTPVQVVELASRHGLQLSSEELTQLCRLVGGFPYLVRLALYEAMTRNVPLPNLLSEATRETGIYSRHLHMQLWHLQQNPELAIAYRKTVQATEPIRLDQVSGFKLKSMGLVNLEGDHATVSCELYRRYFGSQLERF